MKTFIKKTQMVTEKAGRTVIATLILLACCLPASVNAQDTSLLLSKAKTAFENNKFDEAIAYLNAVINLEPVNEEALTYRARAFIILKKVPEAAANADKVLAINPKNLFALNVRGMAKGANKDYEGAIADFTRAVTIDPAFYRAYYQRARAKAFNGATLPEVLADYNLSLKYFDEPSILQDAGNYCLDRKGEAQICAAYFSRIKTKKPESAIGFLGYALAYFNVYETVIDKSIFNDEILENFRKAVELDPKDEIAPLNLGRLLNRIKDYEGAISAFTQAITNNPQNSWAYTLRGDSYYNKSDFDRAIADYSKAIEISPAYKYAWLSRGEARAGKAGNQKIGYKTPADIAFWRHTLSDYQKATELSKNDLDTYKALDEFFWELGRFVASEQNSSALSEQIELEKKDYYQSLFAADPKNICAKYFLIQRVGYFPFKSDWDAIINNYDGKNGGKCAAEAALSIGKEYSDKYGAQQPNLEKAKEYFELAKKLDPAKKDDADRLTAALPGIKWNPPAKDATASAETNYEKFREQQRAKQNAASAASAVVASNNALSNDGEYFRYYEKELFSVRDRISFMLFECEENLYRMDREDLYEFRERLNEAHQILKQALSEKVLNQQHTDQYFNEMKKNIKHLKLANKVGVYRGWLQEKKDDPFSNDDPNYF